MTIAWGAKARGRRGPSGTYDFFRPLEVKGALCALTGRGAFLFRGNVSFDATTHCDTLSDSLWPHTLGHASGLLSWALLTRLASSPCPASHRVVRCVARTHGPPPQRDHQEGC